MPKKIKKVSPEESEEIDLDEIKENNQKIGEESGESQ